MSKTPAGDPGRSGQASKRAATPRIELPGPWKHSYGLQGDRRVAPCCADLLPEARRLAELSAHYMGEQRSLRMLGRHPSTEDLLRRIRKIANFDEPVLITGESGAGKEMVARALQLLGKRHATPFVAVNCPQYQEGNLTVSELFGHVRGSFTGANADRKGCFEEADGGVVFLDEVGDLPMAAQVMLLRALAEGEFKPIGSNQARRVNVRVVAATNRPLETLMQREAFRSDLYFRLRYFALEVPPLRDRGDDWRVLMEDRLDRLAQQHGICRRLSAASLDRLQSYDWPGNIRELFNIATMGYAMADGDSIEPRHFQDFLLGGARPTSQDDAVDALFRRLTDGRAAFWEDVHQPFIERELNRAQVRDLVRRGLHETQGSYRRLTVLFRAGEDSYQRFMDFLRHHQLKP